MGRPQQKRWFIKEHPMKTDDLGYLGVPPFQETSLSTSNYLNLLGGSQGARLFPKVSGITLYGSMAVCNERHPFVFHALNSYCCAFALSRWNHITLASGKITGLHSYIDDFSDGSAELKRP